MEVAKMSQELLQLQEKRQIVADLLKKQELVNLDRIWPYAYLRTNFSAFSFNPRFVEYYQGAPHNSRFYDDYTKPDFRQYVERFFMGTYHDFRQLLDGRKDEFSLRNFDELGFWRNFSLETLKRGSNVELLAFAYFAIERWKFVEVKFSQPYYYDLAKMTILETCRHLASEWKFFEKSEVGKYRNEYLVVHTEVFYEIAQILLANHQFDNNLKYALASYERALRLETEKVAAKEDAFSVETVHSKILELVENGKLIDQIVKREKVFLPRNFGSETLKYFNQKVGKYISPEEFLDRRQNNPFFGRIRRIFLGE